MLRKGREGPAVGKHAGPSELRMRSSVVGDKVLKNISGIKDDPLLRSLLL